MAPALQEYRARRDFTRTPEPHAGPGRSRGRLRFVIQKHAARRLHYDLRLEWGGVLKSWAVTKEPVADPAVKRLAVEVEDHPLAYGRFAGTIPAGQYGAGVVEIWDEGSWAPDQPDRVDEALAAGHLSFTLAGTRLSGGFALIRMKPKKGEKRNNWLLVKERDAPLQQTAPARAPARRGTAVMPDFLPLQHCIAAESPPAGRSWIHELKFDGYRVQCAVTGGRAVLRTRSGADWTQRFPTIAAAASALPDCVLDGEAVALDAQGMPDFAALQASVSGEKPGRVVYFAFDLLRAQGRDMRGRPQRDRKDRLRALLAAAGIDAIRYVEDFSAPGEAVLRGACRLSMEGVVSKRVDRPYAEGRSGAWIKTKCRGSEEVVIGGWTLNTHGDGLGALLVGARRQERLTYIGRVGTGFGADRSRRLLAALAPLERQASPFAGPVPAGRGEVHWAKPELVAQVAFAGWTEKGMLRQASFTALREDKPAREVTMPSPMPATTKAAPKAAMRLTSPEKVLWPAEEGEPEITKAMLAAYVERLAPRLMAGLRGRPLSILRVPDGITGQRFFQRHAMRGLSPLLKQVRIPGQAKPYLMIEEAAGLLALAQMAAVELHPWGAMAATPDRPDRLVFDLDPGPGVDFTTVRDAARQLRTLLSDHGLTGFPRTSGGKGLHVVVPIASPPRKPAADWPRAKAVALALCQMMEREAPARFTTRMTKSLRDGRIFLDYLRNDRLATAIGSWSPRARPGAPIARPLSWSSLSRVGSAAEFHLTELLSGRLPADPWHDLDAAAAPLPDIRPKSR